MTFLRQTIQLPRRVLRRITRLIAGRFAALGSRHPDCAKLYYAIFDNAFTREQVSVLAGQRAYHDSLLDPSGTMTILRRNVHRLEKGLLMRPRRIPFALDYIGETIDAFLTTSSLGTVDPRESAWANDVLAEYFCVHVDEQATKGLAAKFGSAKRQFTQERGAVPQIPYLRDLSSPPPVSYAALLELANRRRSVRWFLQKRVERCLIDQALEVALQAPSACNRQPFEFRIFDDPPLVQKVINIPFGLAGYGHNVPVVGVVIGQQRHFFSERDRHLIYIDSSLAVMGFAFALETLGLSSCCVNWPDIASQEKRMTKLLGLASDERPIMLLAIGYPDPDGLVACSTKKSLQQVRQYNFE
jgi:nitroreductase